MQLRDLNQAWSLDATGTYTALRGEAHPPGKTSPSCHEQMMEHVTRQGPPIGWAAKVRAS